MEQGEVMEMSQKFLQEIKHGNSLVGPVSKSAFHWRGTRVQSLVRGLRSHMPDGTANKKYTRTKTCYVPQGRGMQWTQALVHPFPLCPISHPFLPHRPHFLLSHVPPGTLPGPREEAREASNGNLTMPRFTGDLGLTFLLPRASVPSLSAR